MRILLVEDNRSLASGLTQALRQRRIQADCVPSAEAAHTAMEDGEYDALILDLGLPGQSGLDFLKALRRRPGTAVPVLVLTARDAITDRVLGLNLGADDYLVKPCDADELAARVRAVVRRAHGHEGPQISHGDLRIDLEGHRVTRRGEPVSLSPREFRVLTFLIERRGRVQSRQQIEDALYGWGEGVESNAVEVHVHNLRRKLGEELIETVRGAGYRVSGNA